MGCQQTGYRQVHHTSKLTPPYKKFTAEISNTEATFLDTVVYIRKRSQNQSTLDVKTHFKPTETFQCTHFSSCSPPGVKKKIPLDSYALTLLKQLLRRTFTNSIHISSQEVIQNVSLRNIKFTESESVLKQKMKTQRIYCPL